MNNKRCRNIELIIYTKDMLDLKIDILEFNNIDYAYILHDKDIDDNGNLKKPHYHLRIFHNTQKTITAWSDLLGVKNNEIQVLENKRRAIRYLIHLDSPNKYQYNMLDIVTNMGIIDNYFNEDKISEESSIVFIFDYIESIQGYIYLKEVKEYVLQNNYWSAYRRYYTIIKDIILEHNRYCKDYLLDYYN